MRPPPLPLALALCCLAPSACVSTGAEPRTPTEESAAIPPQDRSEEEGEMCLEPPPEETDPEPCE